MATSRSRIPNAFEPPRRRSSVPPEDILASDRVVRRRRFLPLFGLSSRVRWVFLVAFLGVGGFVLFSSPSFSGLGSSFEPLPDQLHPEAGRSLNAHENLGASFYGEPLRLGSGGFPVVLHADTGDVREMTPVEQEYIEQHSWPPPPFAQVGFNQVVWTPGPRGWGMWWQHDPLSEVFRLPTLLDREGWRLRQQRELQVALSQLDPAMELASRMSLDPWVSGYGVPLRDAVAELREGRPRDEHRIYWYYVPKQWLCSDPLESALRAGVTQGCPPVEFDFLLVDVWSALGAVADRLWGISLMAVDMDAAGPLEVYQSGVIPDHAAAHLELIRDIEELVVSVDRLEYMAVQHRLPISVHFLQF